MTFLQIIEGQTDEFDAINALADAWEQATEGRRTARRSITTRDRNDPSHFVTLVFFDSYESAMENSSLPETQEFSGKLAALLTATPTFHDLDVVVDRDAL